MKGSRNPSAPLTPQEQTALILDILCEFAEHGADDLFQYFDHVGFDPRVIKGPSELPSAWLGHYRVRCGEYDVDRACNDFATWPPIASRIFELMREARS